MIEVKELKKLSDNPDNNHYYLRDMRLIVKKPEIGQPCTFVSNYYSSKWFRTSRLTEITISGSTCRIKTKNSIYEFKYKEPI